MRAQLSSVLITSPTTPYSFPFIFHTKPVSRKPSSSIRILNSRSEQPPQENLRTTRKIGDTEPPWLVPAPPKNPFSGEGLLFDHQLKDCSGIPFSLRLVQMKKKKKKKKKENLVFNTTPATSAELGSIGNAVWTLACLLQELQMSMVSGDNARVSRDSRDSIVWLFQRVFSTSPDLAIGILVLTAKFIVKSTERIIFKIGASLLKEKEEEDDARSWSSKPPEIGDYNCWSDIGILDESERRMQNDRCPDYMRKKMAYERMIITEKDNSLILLNYAQLLYQYEKDLERANDYFLWAVTAEPVDAEAMSRYAVFLWHERGDMEGAEEMFLEAIAADPQNNYHHSNYAWFLWKTGGTDTCYPLHDQDLSELPES